MTPSYLLLLWPFLKYRLSYNSYEQLTNAKSCGQRNIFQNTIRFKKNRQKLVYFAGMYFITCVDIFSVVSSFFYRPLVSILSETADIDRQ